MNKLDLIEALKTETELTKNEATAVVNIFFDEMANALANGDQGGNPGSMFILRQEIQIIYRPESKNR